MNEREMSPLELAQWNIDHLFSLVDVLTKDVEKLNQEIEAMKSRKITEDILRELAAIHLDTDCIHGLREVTGVDDFIEAVFRKLGKI
jgi:hypothetical protein